MHPEDINQFRPLLTTYAYNILGSYEDARDVVQDAFLQFMHTHPDGVENTRAYLVRSVINLSINLKTRYKKRFENYPGEWLPEPVATEHADTAIIKEDILSYSLMVLLEKLNPKQRAVFILKEAFDYDHHEIADVLGITTAHSRKLLSRAREAVHDTHPATTVAAPHDYLGKYLDIIKSADTRKLEELLNEEIMVVSDGGGKATAFRKTVIGKQSVIALLMGIYQKFYAQVRIAMAQVNKEPALFYFENNTLVTCQVFVFENDKLARIYFIRNPDKLKELEKNR